MKKNVLSGYFIIQLPYKTFFFLFYTYQYKLSIIYSYQYKMPQSFISKKVFSYMGTVLIK